MNEPSQRQRLKNLVDEINIHLVSVTHLTDLEPLRDAVRRLTAELDS